MKKKRVQKFFLITMLVLMLGGLVVSIGALVYQVSTTKVIEYGGEQLRVPKDFDVKQIPGAKEVN